MIDEDLLRSALSSLGMHPPLPEDRVGAVRRRIRRRARVRAAAVAAVAVLAVGTAAVTVLPEGGSRESLPAVPGPQEPASYRLPITQVLVSLPDLSYDEQSAAVERALSPVPDLPDRIGRRAVDVVLADDGRRREATVQVDFAADLDPAREEAVRSALAALPGAVVQVADVDGFALELVVPLAPRVVERLGPERIPTPPDALATALRGVFGVDRTAGDELVVEYAGPALSEAELRAAVQQVALAAGARARDVVLRRAGDPGSGASYRLGG